jgi:hypothetical protein
MQSVPLKIVGKFNDSYSDQFFEIIGAVLNYVNMNRDPRDEELCRLREIIKEFSYLRQYFYGSPISSARVRGRFNLLLSNQKIHDVAIAHDELNAAFRLIIKDDGLSLMNIYWSFAVTLGSENPLTLPLHPSSVRGGNEQPS